MIEQPQEDTQHHDMLLLTWRDLQLLAKSCCV
jgi:hypothetical protein